MPPQKKAPTLWTIPAGARPSVCNGPHCEAEIFWIETPRGKRLCVDTECPEGYPPSAPGMPGRDTWPGQGVAHITQCPDAKQFSHKNG